jgi:SAM-dependent methyltransferase
MSFERNAVKYDAIRPGYPDELVDGVLARTGAQRIVEIGAGTGKATAVFVRRGPAITAIEPAASMAAVLRKNVDATIEETTFEAWSGADGTWDLVFAAQAIHWVDPAVRYAKAAQALQPRGWIAILRNEKDAMDAGLRGEVDAAYARWMPSTGDGVRTVDDAVAEISAEIDASASFGPVETLRVAWDAHYTSSEYVQLLDTYSDHATLSDDRRAGLYAAIASAIDRRGGTIHVPYVSIACMAQKR